MTTQPLTHGGLLPVVLTWPGEIHPKARPRTNFRTATIYRSPKYGGCLQWMTTAFKAQAGVLDWHHPLAAPVSIHLVLEGKHPRCCDGDNTLGTVLDALCMAGLLRNDNLKNVPEARVTLLFTKAPPTATVHISRFDPDVLVHKLYGYERNKIYYLRCLTKALVNSCSLDATSTL